MRPSAWIDSLFARLAVRYGTGWTRMWEGFDIGAVKADWSDVLDRVRPESISYALRYLPADRPPTATQFRDICRRAPEALPPQLPAPKVEDAVVKAAVSKALAAIGDGNPKAWPWRLKAREESGNERLTIAQKTMWRAALASERGTIA